MEPRSLVGKTLRAVRVFRSDGVHPAWVDANTLPIVASDAFLEFADGELVRISPCEVDLPDRYPALGLELQCCGCESMRIVAAGGDTFEAIPLEEAIGLMPFFVAGIETSNPLGDEVVSQVALADGNRRLVFRHIMPPMSLGIRVDAAE
jgi:hypothetical protein